MFRKPHYVFMYYILKMSFFKLTWALFEKYSRCILKVRILSILLSAYVCKA